MAGRYDAAIASYRTLLNLSPNRGGAYCFLGMALMQKGDAAAALAEIEQEKSEVWRTVALPMAYCALAQKTEYEKAITDEIKQDETEGPYNIAYVYAFCGDADKAFEWLDKAVAYQDVGLADIVTENLFDKIHSTRAGSLSCAKSARPPTNSPRSSSRCHRCRNERRLPSFVVAGGVDPGWHAGRPRPATTNPSIYAEMNL
jgi:tetratricopeptide (TPR) repeat protein